MTEAPEIPVEELETVFFPYNVVNVLAEALKQVANSVQRRPLNETDSSRSVGVFPDNWNPDRDSWEFREPPEPTIQRYHIWIQVMVKDLSEERGIAAHSQMSNQVRHMLLRDSVLHVALRSMYVDSFNMRERLMKWEIPGQDFFNNRNKGVFAYLSILSFSFETEIKPA